MKRLVFSPYVWVVVLLMGLLWFRWNQRNVQVTRSTSQEQKQLNPMTPQQSLHIGPATLQVEVRRTPEEQTLGLSYRMKMAENEGMIFVYDQPQQVMFWMKGMKFSLDFIWVNQGKVVEVTENVEPPTLEKPTIRRVSPAQQVDMVLEVNAGWVSRNKVQVGDVITLENYR